MEFLLVKKAPYCVTGGSCGCEVTTLHHGLPGIASFGNGWTPGAGASAGAAEGSWQPICRGRCLLQLPARSQRRRSSPRPVFQPVSGNNKGGRSTNGRAPPHDVISPQHEELIRFFNDSWGNVCKELEMGRQNGHDARGSSIAYYQEKNEHPALQDFKPFDLEAWWGKRLYQNLTQST
ncbi:MAPK regulated corepressor interacting protein 2-like isoform X1 [Panulirus ornatus]|uniref:MAPK regulated corepressor interacting protein 2-like isoform X1 n=1 Tax=Panulirus ornatus TaxID=150431 RepID=UPI003A8359C1